jgi:hypothetical protein
VLIWKVRASGTIQKASRVITNGAMKRYGAKRWEYNKFFTRRGPPVDPGRPVTADFDRRTSAELALVCDSSFAALEVSALVM